MFTDKQLEQLAKVIDEKIKPLKEGQESLQAGLERIEKKLDREVTDIAETQREILIKLDKIDDHETRISQLERNLVPRSH